MAVREEPSAFSRNLTAAAAVIDNDANRDDEHYRPVKAGNQNVVALLPQDTTRSF